VAQATGSAGGFTKSQSARRTLIELGIALLALVALVWLGRWGIGCSAERLAMSLPLSVDEKIGAAGAEQMRAKYELGEQATAAQEQRVERVFGELRSALDADETKTLRNPRVTVVVDKQVNAFALPGGEVFVLTGLLERVGPDDAMLRGVLAHEIGHAVRRHGVRGLARRAALSLVVAAVFGKVDAVAATLAAGASELDGLSHSREMESEADAFAVELLRRAGYNPDGLARFLESLGSAPVPELLSTHPDPLERARAIRQQASRGND